MSQFKSGQKVYFDCKTEPSESGEYTIDSEYSAEGFNWLRTSSNEPYVGELYTLKEMPGIVVAGTSLTAVDGDE